MLVSLRIEKGHYSRLSCELSIVTLDRRRCLPFQQDTPLSELKPVVIPENIGPRDNDALKTDQTGPCFEFSQLESHRRSHSELFHSAVKAGSLHVQDFSRSTRASNTAIGFLQNEFDIAALHFLLGGKAGKGSRVCAEAHWGTPHKKTRRLTQPGRKRALSGWKLA